MTADPAALATRLLATLGHGPAETIEPLAGGRNNRAFRVTNPQGSWLLKQYFRGGPQMRDRCGSEWAWLDFGWRHGITTAPQPLACAADEGAALLEYIEGRLLVAEAVRPAHVQAAADYLAAVNQFRREPTAAALPDAAEACRSWADHAACVTRRLARLQGIVVQDDLDAALQHWLRTEFVPVWETLFQSLERDLGTRVWMERLPLSSLRLSPSDFGFHNALLTPEGRLRFLDFEYAGWDDPAKLICDFYWQPACPAPRPTRPLLIAALAGPSERTDLTERVERLFPLHGLRWCCILLNEFLAADRQRREFSAAEAVSRVRREQQLTAAQRVLVEVTDLLRP